MSPSRLCGLPLVLLLGLALVSCGGPRRPAALEARENADARPEQDGRDAGDS